MDQSLSSSAIQDIQFRELILSIVPVVRGVVLTQPAK